MRPQAFYWAQQNLRHRLVLLGFAPAREENDAEGTTIRDTGGALIFSEFQQSEGGWWSAQVLYASTDSMDGIDLGRWAFDELEAAVQWINLTGDEARRRVEREAAS